MSPFHSIRWRLQLWYGILFALILAGLSIAAHEILVRNIQAKIDWELSQLAVAINSSLRAPRRHGETNDAPSDEPLFANKGIFSRKDQDRGVYYAIWRRNGPERFLASPNAPEDIPEPGDNPDGYRSRGALREAFVTRNPGDHVLVGRSIAAEQKALRELAWQIIGGAVLLWSGTMLIGWWLIGRALRPLDAITDTAERIARGDLSQRINTHRTDTELGRLAEILNSTFARLEAAFARQTQFTGDAAHELRTPVTVLLTHLQNVLSNDDLSEENREAVEACQRAAQRMRNLIESLLRLARIDQGPGSLHWVPCDLAQIARETIDLVKTLARNRRIAIQADLAPAHMEADPDGVAQVISNLLTNAVYYGREGGEIRISTSQAGDQTICVIEDNGPGIAAEHLPHIFDRFYRVDRARTTQMGRSGLGLAISKAIMAAHGGEISVQSVPAQGTKFTLSFPRKS